MDDSLCKRRFDLIAGTNIKNHLGTLGTRVLYFYECSREAEKARDTQVSKFAM